MPNGSEDGLFDGRRAVCDGIRRDEHDQKEDNDAGGDHGAEGLREVGVLRCAPQRSWCGWSE